MPRKRGSRPCRWLDKQGRLVAPILDWGCGHGTDVEWMGKQGYHADGYDPHYRPELPPLKSYTTILCTYVLNTIPNYHDRCVIVEEALEYLEKGGWCYVSIRAGKKLKGWTKRGVWQGYVGEQLNQGGFTLIYQLRDMEIWAWRRKH